MREALRNIWRRKARSALTIFGVAIGVFALTTMGALATSINQSIKVGLEYYSSRIIVSSEAGGFGGVFTLGPQIPATLATQAEAIDGVERAYPTIVLTADSDQITFGSPSLVLGSPPEEAEADPNRLAVKDGHSLQAGAAGKVVIGSNIATKEKLKVGDSTDILGRPFEVVGVLQFVNSDPDSYYIVSLDDAKQLMQETSQYNTAAADLVTNINVLPKNGADTTALAKTIEETFPNTQATPPDQLKQSIEDASAVLNLIVLGSALIAVLVGALSVINTMLVSVGERRKEIGIKRVVGARNRHLFREIILETALIGLIGGLVGFGAGAGLVTLINSQAQGSGFTFTLTPDLAAVAIGFAVVLGIIAGLYPAWRAIRIKPVQVLREE